MCACSLYLRPTGTTQRMRACSTAIGTTTGRMTTTTLASVPATTFPSLTSRYGKTGDIGSYPSSLLAKSAGNGFLVPQGSVSHA